MRRGVMWCPAAPSANIAPVIKIDNKMPFGFRIFLLIQTDLVEVSVHSKTMYSTIRHTRRIAPFLTPLRTTAGHHITPLLITTVARYSWINTISLYPSLLSSSPITHPPLFTLISVAPYNPTPHSPSPPTFAHSSFRPTCRLLTLLHPSPLHYPRRHHKRQFRIQFIQINIPLLLHLALVRTPCVGPLTQPPPALPIPHV